MEINQAKPADLIEILYLLRTCILDMNAKGLTHWNSSYPDINYIKKDLLNGSIFVAKDKGVCKGMVTLDTREPDEYRQLTFPGNKQKPLYLQNMVVHPKWRGLGIASELVSFAQKYASENGFDCIRLNVYKSSEDAIQLYEKQLFKEIGSFQAEFQKIPFICYEKQL